MIWSTTKTFQIFNFIFDCYILLDALSKIVELIWNLIKWLINLSITFGQLLQLFVVLNKNLQKTIDC